ncbi:hypothetical protein [Rhodococcus aerolatus]
MAEQQNQEAAATSSQVAAVLAAYAQQPDVSVPALSAALAAAVVAGKARASMRADVAVTAWAREHGQPAAVPLGVPVPATETARLEQAFETVADRALDRLDAVAPRLDQIAAVLDAVDAELVQVEQRQASKSQPRPSVVRQARNVVMVGTRKPAQKIKSTKPERATPATSARVEERLRALREVTGVERAKREQAARLLARAAREKQAAQTSAKAPEKAVEPRTAAKAPQGPAKPKAEPKSTKAGKAERTTRADDRARREAERARLAEIAKAARDADRVAAKAQRQADKDAERQAARERKAARKAEDKATRARLKELDRLDREEMKAADKAVDRRLAQQEAAELASEMLPTAQRLAESEVRQTGFETLGKALEDKGVTRFKWVAEPGACKFCLERAEKIYRKRLVYPQHVSCGCHVREATEEEVNAYERKKKANG